MRNTTHPNLILGIVSILLILVGVTFKANGYRFGDYVVIGSVFLGAIHWIWSIIDVFKNQPVESQSRVLWIILVVLIPPLGGIFYYLMSRPVKM